MSSVEAIFYRCHKLAVCCFRVDVCLKRRISFNGLRDRCRNEIRSRTCSLEKLAYLKAVTYFPNLHYSASPVNQALLIRPLSVIKMDRSN